ncbi:MAG: spermine/spermidine synthase domain-containing protein [Caldimonas sp.]
MSAAAAPLPEVTISESRGVRYLHLGTPWIQGAMRIDEPLEIELEYVRRMMAWTLFLDDDDIAGARLVQLGLGTGTIARFCSRRMKMRVTVVEINGRVVDACRQWFRLPAPSKAFDVVTTDAGRWVADPAHRGTADVLAVDLYDHESASPVLDSPAFYRHCHDVLAEGGTMTVNVFGRNASFETSMRRIAAAFGGVAAVRMLQPTAEGNTVVLAMKQVTLAAADELARRAENIETRWQLPARKWLRMLRPAVGPGATDRS